MPNHLVQRPTSISSHQVLRVLVNWAYLMPSLFYVRLVLVKRDGMEPLFEVQPFKEINNRIKVYDHVNSIGLCHVYQIDDNIIGMFQRIASAQFNISINFV